MTLWVRKCSWFEEDRLADREFWAQLAVPAHYIGGQTFIRNKQAAGRPQDLADIDALR